MLIHVNDYVEIQDCKTGEVESLQIVQSYDSVSRYKNMGYRTRNYAVITRESDADGQMTISDVSPLGKALLEKKVGSVIEVCSESGAISKYRILSLRPCEGVTTNEAEKNKKVLSHADKLNVCRKEWIFPDFPDRYKYQLIALRNNPSFRQELRQARGNISPNIEFCTDKNNDLYKDFKKRFSTYLYERVAHLDYPALWEIIEDVRRITLQTRGKCYGFSTIIISVYYALCYMKLMESAEQK